MAAVNIAGVQRCFGILTYPTFLIPFCTRLLKGYFKSGTNSYYVSGLTGAVKE